MNEPRRRRPFKRGRVLRKSTIAIAWKAAILIVFLLAASAAGDWVMTRLAPHFAPDAEISFHRAILVAVFVYVLLMMLPFVPSFEVGLGMMMMFGAEVAPLVYGGTVLALVLAFAIGRLVPQGAILGLFAALRLRRAAHLLERLEPLDPAARLEYLFRNTPSRLLPFLLRHRFLALMIVLNLPGNGLVGGGGGIALMAGFSRLFGFPAYVLAISIAVAPVPLLVYAFGG